MSYEPTTWKAGDTVTSAKLNKMEQGIASSSAFIVHGTVSENTVTLDKTWKEIYDASETQIVYLIDTFEMENEMVHRVAYILHTIANDNNFYVEFRGDEEMGFITDSEDGYPMFAADNTNQGGFPISTPVRPSV